MWLECISVVSGCCKARRSIDIVIILLIPIPLVLTLFLKQIPTSLFIFETFFHSCKNKKEE